jgi:hypothetical protein
MKPIDSCTAEEARIVEMEVIRLAAEDMVFRRGDRVPVAEACHNGTYILVTAGDDRITIYKGSPAWRRQIMEDSVAFGERFDKRDYIQQVDVSMSEARTVLRGLLKVTSILDVLADAA